jgi:hypothetical protein
MITRIRFQRKAICGGYNGVIPTPIVYLAPEDRRSEYFRLFGPCFSTPFSTAYLKRLGAVTLRNNYTDTKGLCIVIPIEQGPNGRIKPFIREQGYEAKDSLEKLLTGLEAVFHTGPNEEDVKSFCESCPRNLERHMGRCVPGQPVCFENLTLHVDRRIVR